MIKRFILFILFLLIFNSCRYGILDTNYIYYTNYYTNYFKDNRISFARLYYYKKSYYDYSYYYFSNDCLYYFESEQFLTNLKTNSIIDMYDYNLISTNTIFRHTNNMNNFRSDLFYKATNYRRVIYYKIDYLNYLYISNVGMSAHSIKRFTNIF